MPNPIDAIIRLVEPSEKPSEPGDVHLLVDPAVPRVLPNTLINRVGRRHHYIVNTEKRMTRGGLVVTLDSLTTGQLTLRVAYEAKVARQGAELLAKAVAKAATPQEAVDHLLEQFIQSFGPERLVGNYEQESRALELELLRVARETLGLELKLLLNPGLTELSPVPLPVTMLSVRTRDSSLQLAVSFECVLEVDPSQRIVAHARAGQLDQLKAALLREADSFLRTQLSLHQLYAGLHDYVPQRFLESTAGLAAAYGRTVVGLIFRCDFAAQHAAFRNIRPQVDGHSKFEYQNPRYPGPIQVDASYNLRLVDVAKLLDSDVTNVESWLQRRIEQASRDVLFNVSHEELCGRFAQSKSDLAARVKQAVERIGYQLQHFITVTDHQLDELLRGRELVTKVDFVLKSDDVVKSSLRVFVKVQIGDFSKVIEKVKHNETVALEMQHLIERTVAFELRQVKPEDFYKYFDNARPVEPGAEGQAAGREPRSVREQLEQAIRSRLSKEYGARVSHIEFRDIDSDLKRLWLQLTGRTTFVKFAVQPGNVDPIHFTMELKVVAVHEHSWHAFQSALPYLTIEELTEKLGVHVGAELSKYEAVDFQRVTPDLEHEVQQVAATRALDSWGLVVRRLNLVRHLGELDGEEIDANKHVHRRVIADKQNEQLAGLEARQTLREHRLQSFNRILADKERYREQYQLAMADNRPEEAGRYKELMKQSDEEAQAIEKSAQQAAIDAPVRRLQSFGDGRAPLDARPRGMRLPSSPSAPSLPAEKSPEPTKIVETDAEAG